MGLKLFRRTRARLREELLTRKGRRRLGRRLASRFLVLAVCIAWTYPFVDAFWLGELGFFVSGRVVVAGGDVPVLCTAVVLVPEPDASAAPLAAYARIDPADPVALPDRSEDAAVWLWPDVDGWFGGMHVAIGLPYRVEVRRPRCVPVPFGVRRFRLLDFWSRRLRLEVSPCQPAFVPAGSRPAAASSPPR